MRICRRGPCHLRRSIIGNRESMIPVQLGSRDRDVCCKPRRPHNTTVGGERGSGEPCGKFRIRCWRLRSRREGKCRKCRRCLRSGCRRRRGPPPHLGHVVNVRCSIPGRLLSLTILRLLRRKRRIEVCCSSLLPLRRTTGKLLSGRTPFPTFLRTRRRLLLR